MNKLLTIEKKFSLKEIERGSVLILQKDQGNPLLRYINTNKTSGIVLKLSKGTKNENMRFHILDSGKIRKTRHGKKYNVFIAKPVGNQFKKSILFAENDTMYQAFLEAGIKPGKNKFPGKSSIKKVVLV